MSANSLENKLCILSSNIFKFNRILTFQIIEDSEERLSEEQVEELIGLVELHLPDIDNPQTLVNGTPGK